MFLSLGHSALPGSAFHHLLENTPVLILDSAAAAVSLAWLSYAISLTLDTFGLANLSSGWAETTYLLPLRKLSTSKGHATFTAAARQSLALPS